MSAVLKPQTLETIFDHNVTDAEFEELLGEPENLDEYLYALSQDSAYAHLYFLYDLRGDDKTAKEFLNKIQDKNYRRDISLSGCVTNN